MKRKEKLNALKEEVETLNKKLHDLTDEELAQVSGGVLSGDGGPGIELPHIVLDPDFEVYPFCE